MSQSSTQLVDQYLDWHHTNTRKGAAGVFFTTFLGPKMGAVPSEDAKNEARSALVYSLKQLELQLSQSPFLGGGDNICIGDLLAACELRQLDVVGFDFSPYPRVQAWLVKVAGLSNWPNVNAVLDKVVHSQKKSKL